MRATSPSLQPVLGAELRRAISRFIRTTRERGEFDIDRCRRTQRRCHRSWPLLVSFQDPALGPDMGVAMHNASPLGIAFLCPRYIPVGATVHVKLFWDDENSPFVPAVVRHATRNAHGYLIGCVFAVCGP
ncbi:MAG: PilZ domain-containing protein [Planctomycetota bacterium]